MYSLPFVSVMTAPSPDAITTSVSAITCMSAKPCQNRVVILRSVSTGALPPASRLRRWRGRAHRRCPDADGPGIERTRQLPARWHRRQARRLTEQAHLSHGELPGEIRVRAGGAEPDSVGATTTGRRRVLRRPEQELLRLVVVPGCLDAGDHASITGKARDEIPVVG